ncbi:putative efflux protein, MATE family [Sphaerochaeta pleomorpha str. Grapes]|uniref:Multidrug-efflux transporter n=1 Tax=Sphaerochaeta pleomorpha (strain ATCC BAA-1885 / DSM 22778 / Grapes) TaxID=158190 RepID=G8QSE0_SPHPG|nr:MATE family efflux transporter [Sphaerochaeta pleomorpha]AEV30070.1 putative efflux protein, MATE family [Sphaerochaeta pleomorpha str. Grapes]
MKTNTRLMTTGSIQKNIISFALPIFIGSLFQQLYNTTDSLVVGNYVGKEALAAITSCAPMIFLLVGLFQGIFVGAGVVISNFFGSGNLPSVRKAIHTAVAFGLASSLVLTLLGYLGSPHLLRWMGTPDSVFQDANTYIQIYFLGIGSLILYNTAAGILRAVGDSRHPLYFLIIASILNIVLDILFVAVFHLGIAGTAYATIISQTVSVFFSFRLLFTSKEIYKIELRQIRFHDSMLPKILKIGIPSGIQNSVTSLANVFVQASINLFGATAMAGNGAFLRIQGFALIPVTSFALALTTYTSQNLGAGELDRVKKGARFGIIFSMILAESIGLLLYLYAGPLLSLFSRDSEVIAIGIQKARIASTFLFAVALSHTMAGLFRGAGKSIVPMSVMLSCWCIIRMLYIKIGLTILMDIRIVFWAYPITWTLSSILFLTYYFTSGWMKNKL